MMTSPAQDTSGSTRNRELETRLCQISKQQDFPALAEHIQELMRRVQEDEITVRQITDIILKDVGLSLRILCTANSARYNRSGKPILMVNHAVMLMGLEAVRDLAASMLLFQHFRNRTPELRQLMALSLLTANHARAAATHIGYPRCEEAYLCGMFRNLGEVLTACYFPRDYGAVLAHMKQLRCPEKQACMHVLQFRYEELGQATVRRWNMPPRIAATMAPEVRRHLMRHSEDATLHELASFAHELTTVMHRETAEGQRARMTRLLEAHGPLLDLRMDQLERIAVSAIEETKATFEMLQIPMDELRFRAQMERAIESLSNTTDLGEPREHIRTVLERCCHELEDRIAAGSGCDVNAVVRTILGGLLGAGFERALFCLVTADHRQLYARLGAGDDIEELTEQFRFSLDRRRGPLGAALTGQKDLYVREGPWLDSSFAHKLGAASFLILPLIIDGVLAGCFYSDCRTASGPVLDAKAMADLARLRDMAATAIQSRHAESQ